MSLSNGQAEALSSDAALLNGSGDGLVAPVANIGPEVMTSFEFWLSAILLLFGLIVVGAQLYLATRRGPEGAPSVSVENGIRLSIVTLIIVGALVLIASGYSNNQIAPAMGLFGTIAGYLIGKQDRS